MDTIEFEEIDREIRDGKLEAAREKAFTLLRKDPEDYLAWFLLSKCWNDIQARMDCLQSAISINPNDERVVSEFTSVKKQFDNSLYSKTPPVNTKRKPTKRRIVDEVKPPDEEKSSEEPNNERTVHKVYQRKLEDDFFHCQEVKLDPSSRMASGIFGNHIKVDGISISYTDLPPCLKILDSSQEDCCDNCEFFSSNRCLLRFDEYFVHEIYTFNKMRLERQLLFLQRSRLVAKLVHDELIKHGRPLHYSVISKMVVDRYPKFNLSKQEVYQFILMHPEIIIRVDEGIYTAK
jgi:hypothetical protein